MFGDTCDPPNELMANREDKLNQITASTVEASYSGGGVFILRARDDKFWGDTYEALDDHGFQITKHLGGDMYIEKAPTQRDLDRRAEAEKRAHTGAEEPMSSDRATAAEQVCPEDVDEWVAVDDLGAVVAGPFETDEEAWTALDGTHADGTGFAEPAGWHDDDAPRSLGDTQ